MQTSTTAGAPYGFSGSKRKSQSFGRVGSGRVGNSNAAAQAPRPIRPVTGSRSGLDNPRSPISQTARSVSALPPQRRRQLVRGKQIASPAGPPNAPAPNKLGNLVGLAAKALKGYK